ncbi:MAG: type II secretion system protein [Akkermansiaceae bacterium]|nr:type II secretion system protein [Akkermansiaceae bacterium]
MKRITKNGSRGGFTLMETLLALALVSTLVSIFLVVFVPARGLVNKSLAQQDCDRLIGVLKTEIKTIRADERASDKPSENKYVTSFDKGFYWLRKTNKPDSAIVIFSYRENLSDQPGRDGTRPAISARESVPGLTSNLVTIACPIDDPVHSKHIRDAVGPVFLVSMTQLEFKDGEWKANGKPGVISGAGSPEDFIKACSDQKVGGACIFYRADFYMLNTPNPNVVRNKKWSQMGAPVFSTNMSFGLSS